MTREPSVFVLLFFRARSLTLCEQYIQTQITLALTGHLRRSYPILIAKSNSDVAFHNCLVFFLISGFAATL